MNILKEEIIDSHTFGQKHINFCTVNGTLVQIPIEELDSAIFRILESPFNDCIRTNVEILGKIHRQAISKYPYFKFR